jgi:hypothetical protein
MASARIRPTEPAPIWRFLYIARRVLLPGARALRCYRFAEGSVVWANSLAAHYGVGFPLSVPFCLGSERTSGLDRVLVRMNHLVRRTDERTGMCLTDAAMWD